MNQKIEKLYDTIGKILENKNNKYDYIKREKVIALLKLYKYYTDKLLKLKEGEMKIREMERKERANI